MCSSDLGDVQILRPMIAPGTLIPEEPEEEIVEEEDEIEEEEIISDASEDEGNRPARQSRPREATDGEAPRDGETAEGARKRRRRRRRRGGGGDQPRDVRAGDYAPMPIDAPQPTIMGEPFTGTRIIGEDGAFVTEREVMATERNEGETSDGGRRRRGRRGGRRNGRDRDDQTVSQSAEAFDSQDMQVETTPAPVETVQPTPENIESVPVKKGRAPRKVKAKEASIDAVPVAAVEPVAETPPAPASKGRARRKSAKAVIAPENTAKVTDAPAPDTSEKAPHQITTEPVVIADPNKPKKGGWWAKAKATLGG